MSRTKIRQDQQIANTRTYSDAYADAHSAGGAKPAFNQVDLEHDLNVLRTNMKQLKGSADFYTQVDSEATLGGLKFEDGNIRSFIGKDSYGTNMPGYSTHIANNLDIDVYDDVSKRALFGINDGDSLEESILRLDGYALASFTKGFNAFEYVGPSMNEVLQYVRGPYDSYSYYLDAYYTDLNPSAGPRLDGYNLTGDILILDNNLKRIEDGYANEDGFIRSFIGKSAIGSQTPDYNARAIGNSQVDIIGNNDDLELAIAKLDDGYSSLKSELNNFTLQRAYDQDPNGSDAVITTNSTDGAVKIAGTEKLWVSATEGLDVDTKADFDVSQFDVDSSSGFSIDATAASNVSVTSANLTLSTVTSGNVVVTAAQVLDMGAASADLDTTGAISLDAGANSNFTVTGDLDLSASAELDMDGATFNLASTGDGYISASGANLDITTAGNLDMDAATVNMNTSSTMDLASNGAMKMDSASSLELEATGKMILDAQALGADALDIDSAGGIDIDATSGTVAIDAQSFSIDATAASNVSVAGFDLSLSTSTSGNVAISGADDVTVTAGDDIEFLDSALSATVAMTRGAANSVSSWSAGVGEAYGASATFGTLGIVEAINELGDGYASLSNELDAFTLQRAYNQGKALAAEDILIADNDNLNIRLAGDNALFQVSNDDGSKTLTVRDGYVQVDGYLLVTGSTTQIETTVTDADHMLLSPVAGSAVPALKIDAASGFTYDLLVVEDVGSSAVAFAIENDGDAYFGNDVQVLGVLNLDGSVDADISSMDVDASGAVTIDAGAASTFAVTNTLSLSTTGNFELDLTSGGALDMNAAGAATLDAASVALTASSGDVTLTASDDIEFLDLALANAVAITRGSSDAVSTWSVGISEAAASPGRDFSNLGIVEAINELGDGYASLSDELDAFTLQRAYNQDADGSDALITTNSTDGAVKIAGTEKLWVSATEGLDVDTKADFDVSQFDVDSSSGFSIDATAASNVSVAGANLTLSTTTSGNVVVTAAQVLDMDASSFDVRASGDGYLSASGANFDISAAGNLDMDAASIDMDATGAISLGAASASDFTVSANLTLSATGSGSDLILSAADVMDMDAASFDLDATGAFDLLAQSFSVKSSADGYISASGANLDITTAGNLDMDAATVNMDASSTMDLASTGAMKLDSASSLELEATGKMILDAQALGADALDIDSAGGIQMNAVGAIAIDAGSSLSLEASAGDAYMNAIGGDVKLTASGDGYFDVAGELFLADSRSASTGGPSGAFRLSTAATGLASGDDFSTIVRGMAGVAAGAELGIINAINAIAAGSGSAFEKAVWVLGAGDVRVTSNRVLSLTGPDRGAIEVNAIGGDGYSSLFKAERDLEVWVNGVLMLPADSPVTTSQTPADDYCLASNDLTKLVFSFDLVEGDIIVVKNNRPAAGENLDSGWSY